MPSGRSTHRPRPRIDSALVKALARARRWQREKIDRSYLCRVLRLTLLAPDIVEAILDGRQPSGLQLDALLKPFPVEWDEQRRALSRS